MKKAITNIRIKKHYTLIPHSLNQVELRKGVWNPTSFTLSDESGKGKLFSILADLNGNNSVVDISKKHQVSRADIEGILDQLQQLDAIENSSSSLLDCYIEQACPSVMQRLYLENNNNLKKVLVIGKNAISAILINMINNYFPDLVVECLDEEGEQYKTLMGSEEQWLYDALKFENQMQIFSNWNNCFVIYAQEIINPIICARLNVVAHELRVPWLHGAIDGPFLFVGPLFLASSGSCYSCFETRVSMNMRENSSYVRYKQAIVANKIYEKTEISLHSPLVHLLASHLALEVANYLATGTGFTRNKVLSIYLPTMEITYNEVLKVASCVVCGSVEHRDNQQLYFDYQTLFKRDLT